VRYLFLFLLLFSCQKERHSSEAGIPPGTGAALVAEAVPADAVPAESFETPFAWRWRAPHEAAGDEHALRIEQSTSTVILEVQKPRDRCVGERKKHVVASTWPGCPSVLTLRLEDRQKHVRWQVELDPDYDRAGVMTLYKEWIIVVQYSGMATGATLWVFDKETGKKVHHTSLHGLGSIAHSKYKNAVQLEILDDKIVISGDESAGQYVEVYEPGTWKRLGNTLIDAKLTALDWREPPREDYRRTDFLKTPDREYVYDTSTETLKSRDFSGALRWQTSLLLGRTSMTEFRNHLYVASMGGNAASAELLVFDIRNGQLILRRELADIPAYPFSSEITVEHEHIVIRGKQLEFNRQPAPRFLGVVDPESGQLVVLRWFLPSKIDLAHSFPDSSRFER
jgi:hypothetical protein